MFYQPRGLSSKPFKGLATLFTIMMLMAGPQAATAKPEVPVPPDYILDKQLEGEDPFEIGKPVFSPDNSHIAAYFSSSKAVGVWDTKTGKIVAKIDDSVTGLDALDGLEFSNDGKQLLLLRNFQPMKFLDWQAGKVVREIPLEADPKKILSYAFSPKKDLLAVGTYTGIALWDLNSGKKIHEYAKGQAISGLDMLIVRDRKNKEVRLLTYGRALLPPDVKWHNLAGLIDIDSGKVTPLLDDIPADKKVEGNMTFFYSNFEWSGGHILVTYSVFPPKVKAGVYLIDTWTGKYISQQDLGQTVVKFTNKYMWKPYYGFVIPSNDMSQPSGPYKTSTQFLIPTDKGLKILDTVDENKLSIFGIRINHNNDWAAIEIKKDAQDTCKLFLYKVVPKK